MSMAINSISASGVAAMLYGMPINKPSRIANVGTGRTTAASVTAGQTAVQATSHSQAAETPSNTAEQVHATFQYALAALDSVGMGTRMTAQSSTVGLQQASSAAYAQVEAQAGQALDITA